MQIKVHVRSHGYIEEFGKDNVVFLTSDSPHVLTGELHVARSLSLSLPIQQCSTRYSVHVP